MPFPSTDQFEKLNDSQLRTAFLAGVYELLQEVAQTGADPKGKPLFEEGMRDFMGPAWMEVQDSFVQLQSKAANLPDEEVVRHGLGGDQLRFKLAATSMRERIYREVAGAGPFRWLLDTLEGLLDSIIDAAGVGGAVKEFKEAVRNSTTPE